MTQTRRPGPTAPATGLEAAEARLSAERTVPCGWVHKHAVEQVLVTDVREIDGRFFALAQLPRTHRLYNDSHDAGYDVLLLGEVARQASEAMVHRLMGVPLDRPFVIGTMRVEVLDRAAVAVTRAATTVLAEFVVKRAKRWPDGTPRHLLSSTILHIGGVPAADFSGTLMMLKGDTYRALREDGAVPSAGAPAHRRTGEPRATPEEVGRNDPRNVVVGGLREENEGITADLVVDLDDPVFFDHELDHLPAMLLLEGARQSALAALARRDGVPARSLSAVDCTVNFHQFAELGAPVTCTAVPDGAGTVAVQLVQGDDVIAEGGITLVTGNGPATGTAD
ncbi:AfsA-related hotdog domain-containing protein [Streptomyces sp. CB03238]|uniref:AfsA-related hotdog domain-containing protein n=1 Tax=Streptomyces sp. CB03238 TaxID=1907777 RepID=UPI0015C425BC|nr:AfsA-related hotdog domain-containing protein [Streptomyces sp. CB03238]